MSPTYLGTCGWEYPEWRGRVYPSGGPADHLRYYSTLFPIVKVDMTFYRQPTYAQVTSWVRRTPARFRFTAKLPRTITHEHRLVQAESELARFLEAIRPLSDSGRLACLLVQLPPSLEFRAPLVRKFYEALPRSLPFAVEFREPSWLVEESFLLLREFSLAYVVVDEPPLPIRLEVTARLDTSAGMATDSRPGTITGIRPRSSRRGCCGSATSSRRPGPSSGSSTTISGGTPWPIAGASQSGSACPTPPEASRDGPNSPFEPPRRPGGARDRGPARHRGAPPPCRGSRRRGRSTRLRGSPGRRANPWTAVTSGRSAIAP